MVKRSCFTVKLQNRYTDGGFLFLLVENATEKKGFDPIHLKEKERKKPPKKSKEEKNKQTPYI